MIDTAMVFAAGKGTRMRPLTNAIPKSLVPVANKALIDYSIENLKKSGIKNIVVNTHYMPGKITSHLQDIEHSSIELTISHEPEILETGGGILKALPLLNRDAFFTVNSDVILSDKKDTTPALKRLADTWDPNQMDILLLLCPTKKAIGYDGNGDFALDNKNKITSPGGKKPYVYTGIQIIHKRLFENCQDEVFSVNTFYRKPNIKVYGIVHEGDWLHIGDMDSIKKAEDWLANHSNIG